MSESTRMLNPSFELVEALHEGRVLPAKEMGAEAEGAAEQYEKSRTSKCTLLSLLRICQKHHQIKIGGVHIVYAFSNLFTFS